MTNHPWLEGGIPMRLIAVDASDDGEWWATFNDDLHDEMTLRIKLVERPRDDAIFLLHLYDPEAVAS